MDARAPLAPSLAREGGLICECTTQCQLALRVHFAHGRVLIWRHCLLHGHVKTPFLHGALRKALRMGPPAAGAVLAFQLAWTTAVLLLAAGSSFEAEQAGPRCKACSLHVLDWRRSAACTSHLSQDGYDVASSAKRAHLEAGGVAAVVRLQPCLLRMAAVCVLQPSG